MATRPTRPKSYLTKGKTKSPDAARKASARRELTSLKGIAGIVGRSVVEGIGGPKARAAKAAARTSAKVARAIANEAAGKGAKAPFPTYRKPSPNRQPRLRDTDGTPRKTTTRQQVGPKTKTGKFTEPKRKTKTNTQRPAGKPVSKSTKVTLPKVIPTRAEIESASRIAKYRGQEIDLSPGQIKALYRRGKPTDTIEARLASGAEKLPVGSRIVSKPSGMSAAEWKAQREVIQRIREADKSWKPGSGKPKPNMATSKARSPKYPKSTKERFRRQTKGE